MPKTESKAGRPTKVPARKWVPIHSALPPEMYDWFQSKLTDRTSGEFIRGLVRDAMAAELAASRVAEGSCNT